MDYKISLFGEGGSYDVSYVDGENENNLLNLRRKHLLSNRETASKKSFEGTAQDLSYDMLTNQ
jgi:hypothetical protein